MDILAGPNVFRAALDVFSSDFELIISWVLCLSLCAGVHVAKQLL